MKKIFNFMLLFVAFLFVNTSCQDDEERLYTVDYERGVFDLNSVSSLKMIEYNSADDSVTEHTLMFRTGNVKSLAPRPQSTQLEIIIDDTLRVQEKFFLKEDGRTQILINDQTAVEDIHAKN